jgi:RNA polymerase sigma-70 factor (ECF subfamily)
VLDNTGPSNSDEAHHLAARLLAGVAIGERHSFSQLYDQFSSLLNAIAFNLLSETTEVEDVLQDVFVKIWNRAHLYSDCKGNAVSWLIVLTRNTALNRLRSKRRNTAAMERAALEPGLFESSETTNAYDHSVANESANSVRRALAVLPSEQQEVLRLAFSQGLTHDEIAGHLNMPLGSVKSRLRRGLARMRDLIAPH